MTLRVFAGAPLKVVSDALGHANIQQTVNAYMHGDEAVTVDWMQRFERQLDLATVVTRTPVERLRPIIDQLFE